MLHSKRYWSISPAETAEDLADKLTDHTWCGCSGFSLGGYLFVNDSTSPDGAGEFAVLKRLDDRQYAQIESITFSWMTYGKAVEIILRALGGEFDNERYDVIEARRIEDPLSHGRCHLCM